jgi:hypothetical protein
LMVAFGFVQRFVPETKGLTLEEIQIKFSIWNFHDCAVVPSGTSSLLKDWARLVTY